MFPSFHSASDSFGQGRIETLHARRVVGRNIHQMLLDVGAIVNGHFVYAEKEDGWYHGPGYVNKDAFYPYPVFVGECCQSLARHFKNQCIEVVVGPTLGGISLSQWTAYWYNVLTRPSGSNALAVYAEEEPVLERRHIDIDLSAAGSRQAEFSAYGNVQVVHSATEGMLHIQYAERTGTRRVLRRGYDKLVRGRRCLVVEDVTHSGKTVRDTIGAIKRAGGTVVGVGALCDRSGNKISKSMLGVPEYCSLAYLDMPMYPASNCPLCKKYGAGSVRQNLGHGKEFLASMGVL
ncbi:MAG: hypothetical protein HY006_02280 [Candidatus Sungbacteria bacterium]|nr:hypothetical protein [Candidatus Sungbacteria bacterium]